MRSTCTKLAAASTMVCGVAGVLFPRRVLETLERLVLAGYENPDDLEPSEWYVSAVRAEAGLAALAGAVVLALEYGGTDGCGSGRDDGDENSEQQ
ncbi:MAG: hypothetical protein ABEK02_07655 [Haloquadratum sp.]